MAGGMLTKQADLLSARYLNDVNDQVSGGQMVSVPPGAASPMASQTQPGDRIVLDDATAMGLSDANVGTLFADADGREPRRGVAVSPRAAPWP